MLDEGEMTTLCGAPQLIVSSPIPNSARDTTLAQQFKGPGLLLAINRNKPLRWQGYVPFHVRMLSAYWQFGQQLAQ